MKSTGYCIVETIGNRVHVITSGVIPTKASQSHGQRLHVIHEAVIELERDYGPLNNTIARERGFSRFQRSTQALYKTHGTLEEALHDYEFVDYPPVTVKNVLTGSGRATKEEVAEAVSRWLDAEITFKTDDESDALAVAITHLLKTEELEAI